MHIIPNEVYHIYNRGNNKQPIFFSDENYLFFLRKITKQLKPICDILCWCLMPNHFHLIINTKEDSCRGRPTFGGKPMQELAYRIGILLSSYSQAINKQNGTRGSLFQQKTKSKNLSETKDYLIECMHYIHQNPLRAGMVNKLEDWQYSSFLDYTGLRQGTLCNKSFLMELTGYNIENFYRDSYGDIDRAIETKIF
jgi:putative transposase